METLFALLCAFLALVCVIFFQSRKKPHPQYPPGPPSLPFIGNALQLGRKPHKVFLKWCEEYGNVFSFKMGSIDTIMLNDAKVIKDVFEKASSAGRTTNPVFEQIAINAGLVMNEGPTVIDQRKFTMRTLRNLNWRMEDKLLEETNYLLDYINKRVNQPINGNRLFNGVISNIIWSVFSGERNDWDTPEPPEMFNLAMNFTGCLNRTLQSGLMFAPFLRYFAPGHFGWTDWVASMVRAKNYMKRVIAKHAENLHLNNPVNFIDHYLVEIHNTTDPKSSFFKGTGEKHLEALLVEFFLGGLETVSYTMAWAIAHLACNPHVQQKLQAELDRVVGENRMPSLRDRSCLPYTEATLWEALRICSIVPHGFPHKMVEDDLICGYFFPKNCTVLANICQVHHDPKTWGDPDVFRQGFCPKTKRR